jgi:hypothetical protein
MQNYVKNLAIQLNNSKNNTGANFSQATNALAYVELLGKKSFQQNNELVYYTALFFGLLSQVATAVSSYSFFEQILAIKLSPTLLPFAVVTLLVFIEILKYVSVHKGLEGYFALPQRTNKGLLAFAVLLCAVSMYASIIGGGHFGIDTQKINHTETKFDTQITGLKTEIQTIMNRNTWKGQTYLGKKEKALVYAKEAEMQQLKSQKASALQTVAEENATAATQYRFGFGFFDVLFLLCSLYVWYFRQQVAIENLLVDNISPLLTQMVHQENTQSNLQAQSPNTQQHAIPKPSTTPIGFQYDFTHLKKNVCEEKKIVCEDTNNGGNGGKVCEDTNFGELHDNSLKDTINDIKDSDITLHDNREIDEYREVTENQIIIEKAMEGHRNCLHCGKLYRYNANKHRYCSDNCRWAAFRLRKEKGE